jgi:hypothetical protein
MCPFRHAQCSAVVPSSSRDCAASADVVNSRCANAKSPNFDAVKISMTNKNIKNKKKKKEI